MLHYQFEVTNYTDNVIGIDLASGINDSFEVHKNSLQNIGFELSKKRMIPSKMNCLGIMVDTKNLKTNIRSNKLQ